MPAWDRIVIASLAGGGAFLALALACGIGWHERSDDAADEDAEPEPATERAEPRASVSLGFIVHGLLSLKWRLTRWLVRRRSGVVPVQRNAPRVRTEPRMDEHSRATLAPEIEDEEIEEEEDEEETSRSPRRRSRGSPPRRRARRAAMRCLRSIS